MYDSVFEKLVQQEARAAERADDPSLQQMANELPHFGGALDRSAMSRPCAP